MNKINDTECHCFIRHARTPAEREQIVKGLEYARSVRDATGTMLALAQLGTCAADTRKDGAK